MRFTYIIIALALAASAFGAVISEDTLYTATTSNTNVYFETSAAADSVDIDANYINITNLNISALYIVKQGGIAWMSPQSDLLNLTLNTGQYYIVTDHAPSSSSPVFNAHVYGICNKVFAIYGIAALLLVILVGIAMMVILGGASGLNITMSIIVSVTTGAIVFVIGLLIIGGICS